MGGVLILHEFQKKLRAIFIFFLKTKASVRWGMQDTQESFLLRMDNPALSHHVGRIDSTVSCAPVHERVTQEAGRISELAAQQTWN
jgi:hypothetical protein